MLGNSQSDDELLRLKRHAFLLNQIVATGSSGLSQTEANKRIPKPIQAELTLSPQLANDVRSQLVKLGYVTERVSKRNPSYLATDTGRSWLQENEYYLPLRPAIGKVNTAASEHIAQDRLAHLLWELLEAPDAGFSPADLNKKQSSQKKKLGLNPATARSVRGQLADRRFITVHRSARSEKYSVTSAGISYLVTLSFDSFGKLTLSGHSLTQLLLAARSGAITNSEPSVEMTSAAPAPASPQDLQSAIFNSVREIRNERYANTGMVPIHEVRSAIRGKYGSTAASHNVFDDIVFDLRRAKKIRLLSISDRGSATEEQLRDSIVGVGETFFYLLQSGDA